MIVFNTVVDVHSKNKLVKVTTKCSEGHYTK